MGTLTRGQLEEQFVEACLRGTAEEPSCSQLYGVMSQLSLCLALAAASGTYTKVSHALAMAVMSITV